MDHVVIVGAGPVGLMLALKLVAGGVRPRIVDKRGPERGAPKAAVLWPRAQVLLDELGAFAPFAARGVPIRRTQVWSGARRLGALRFGADGRPPLAIEQHDTERLLREALAARGVEVEQAKAETLFQDGEAAVLTLRRPNGGAETVRTRWLVGCDGAHSFVRHALDIPFRGGPRRNLQLWQLDARPSWNRGVQADGGHIVLGRGVSVSLYPMPGGAHRIFAFAQDSDPTDQRPNTAEHMRALVAEAADAPELRLEPSEPLWLNRARFQDRTAARFRQGRVLLCGDAAHVWAPVGGHGMNVGLYGADNLARRLVAVVREGADTGALDAYARQQRRLARQVRWATRADMLEQPPGTLRRAALEAVMPPLLSWPAFNRAVDAALGDLRLGRATTGRPSLKRAAP